MQKILPPTKIYISESEIPGGGRGVFANVDIPRGQTIETCPFIEIPASDLISLEQSLLITYIYFFGKTKDNLLLALGFGSIYNHTYTPNAVYKIKPKQKIIEFISTQDIKKDQEITVNYVQDTPSNLSLWFEK